MELCPILLQTVKCKISLRQDTPGSGAYFNEADFFEIEWQEQFWGQDNYNTLLGIKAKWDPEGMFVCHNCVGSEDWDDSGMCRTH